MDEQRRMMLAIGLAGAVLLIWYVLVQAPAERAAQEAARDAAARAALEAPAAAPSSAPQADEAAAAPAQRRAIAVETAALSGSIRLRGALFDDLRLLDYRQELADDSPPVTLFRPASEPGGYYAFHGWQRTYVADADAPGAAAPAPDFVVKGDTPWRVLEGEALSPERPLVLLYDTPDGALHFRRTITVDDQYMFTVADEVFNRGEADVQLQSYGVVRRNGVPADLTNFMILHEGAVGILDDRLVMRKYKRLRKDDAKTQGPAVRETGPGGWIGFADKYWLSALVPPTATTAITTDAAAPAAVDARDADPTTVTGEMRVITRPRGQAEVYETSLWLEPVAVPAGEGVRVTSRLFAGAKRAELLRAYRDDLGIPKFELAIDWGMFWFFTKPIHAALHNFGLWFGNFGLAILMLTIVVKALFFPIANMSYKSMARMKALSPKMQALRERYKDDPQKQQQELIELYRREKVNPAAGCLPLIPQMIVFFALYKTLFITIEMRHAPFFGWIQDMSAPDPTTIWNLFGLLPYDPSGWPLIGGVLAVGVWPVIMGLSMAAMQTLNPPPPDPTQARIIAFMPLIFTFILAPFAAGLVIYWTWNNLLSFAQQYVIVRRQGVETPIGTWVAKTYQRLRAGEITPASIAAGLKTRVHKLQKLTPGAKPDAASPSKPDAKSEAGS